MRADGQSVANNVNQNALYNKEMKDYEDYNLNNLLRKFFAVMNNSLHC